MNPLRAVYDWIFGPSCTVYVATKMTGRDKVEMVGRAKFVCEILRNYGLTPISPILEESVPEEPGKLINHNREQLQQFWKRDKWIIRRPARVLLLDHGELQSFGVMREYCLGRGVLWKPTVMYIPQGTPLSVAPYEDDLIGYSIHGLAAEIRTRWGSRWNYWKWRSAMLNRSLPKWIIDQLWAWA